MEIALIIVIYNIKIEDSKTLNSLNDIALNFDFSKTKIIIYDNSTLQQTLPSAFSFKINYYHNKNNGGLSEAYNYALKKCIEDNISWLLLLDQDTNLHVEYFSEIKKVLPRIEDNTNIVSVIPKIMHNKTLISPAILKKGGFIKKVDFSVSGVPDYSISGINSGTLLNVSFIQSLGGFNPVFKIDMLDYWYFKMIYDKNKKVFIMNSILKHDLSVMNYKNVSTERYKNIVQSEITFFHDYSTKVDFFIFKLRLLLRLIKQFITLKNNKIPAITFHYLVSNNG